MASAFGNVRANEWAAACRNQRPAASRRDSWIGDRRERQLKEYFSGNRTRFELPLAPQGTEFQKRVWEALVRIPFGAVSTYRAQAEALGFPQACRAVGRANGLNPLSIVIPCHRVIGSSGALTGYAGGLAAKRMLLELEAATQG